MQQVKQTYDKYLWNEKSAWTATGENNSLRTWSLRVGVFRLLFVQRDRAVAEGWDPAIHTGLVCREITQNEPALIKVEANTWVNLKVVNSIEI